MPIHGAVRTEQGKDRCTNEDAFGFFPELHFYVVADGMGGHTGGEIASALIVDTLRQYLQAAQAQEAQVGDLLMHEAGPWVLGARKLLSAVEGANAQVFAVSHRRPDLTGMGSTVAALYCDEPRGCVTICHVGGHSRVPCPGRRARAAHQGSLGRAATRTSRETEQTRAGDLSLPVAC